MPGSSVLSCSVRLRRGSARESERRRPRSPYAPSSRESHPGLAIARDPRREGLRAPALPSCSVRLRAHPQPALRRCTSARTQAQRQGTQGVPLSPSGLALARARAARMRGSHARRTGQGSRHTRRESNLRGWRTARRRSCATPRRRRSRRPRRPTVSLRGARLSQFESSIRSRCERRTNSRDRL